MQRVLQGAVTHGRGADDERAIGHGFGDGGEFFRRGEDLGGADGRAGVAKGRGEGIDHAQASETEIAHGARGGANVERVARGYQNDAQAVGF